MTIQSGFICFIEQNQLFHLSNRKQIIIGGQLKHQIQISSHCVFTQLEDIVEDIDQIYDLSL